MEHGDWIICGYCGTENPPEQILCVRCGAPLKHLDVPIQAKLITQEISEAPYEETSGKSGYPIIRLIALIMAGTLFSSAVFGFPFPISDFFKPQPIVVGPSLFHPAAQYLIECRMTDTYSLEEINDSVEILWMHRSEGAWLPETCWSRNIHAERLEFDTMPSDEGYIFAIINSTSKSCYIDYQNTLRSQSFIVDYKFEDVNFDGFNEIIFKIDLRSFPIPSTGSPMIAFSLFVLSTDTDVKLMSSNISSFVPGSNHIDWFLKFGKSRSSLAFYEVRIIVNSSVYANCFLEQLSIPSVGLIASHDMTLQALDNRSIWTYEFSRGTLDGAVYLHEVDLPHFTAHFRLSEGLSNIEISLSIYYLLPNSAASELCSSLTIGESHHE